MPDKKQDHGYRVVETSVKDRKDADTSLRIINQDMRANRVMLDKHPKGQSSWFKKASGKNSK